MVFLFFTSAYLFFKTYGFPFSGSLVLCLTIAFSQFHSSKTLRPNLSFLLFPASLCVLSFWDGTSAEFILDLVSLSLAGMISSGGFSFLGSRSPAFRETLGILILAGSCILSFSRRELSPFLIPALSLFLIFSVPKQVRILILGICVLVSGAWILYEPPHPSLGPSLFKSVLLFLGMVWVLWKGKKDFLSGLLFSTFFLLICLSKPGEELMILACGLFFSYLQEAAWGLDSGTEV
ncbi:hypothetical protein AB3N61_07560 [Leptospira sp. WS58.C1]|uniref:hypothetical protein n=1 Tax=Leptospira TaxID=171 RepID=UPI0002BEEDE2|nr:MULTISPECIES: hypothetical protein [unclassified Leptospira]EMK01852.1 hypothetical protein LEP1GSC192_1403 [Leptospira sp. B5-022]MCR1793437.1 hypothetical protein [Leptospira sp. id769339]